MSKSYIKKRSVEAADAPATGTGKSHITKGSLDAPEGREIWGEMPELAHTPVDEPEFASAREKILEQKYEIEELKAALSGSYVERLKAELSASYATHGEFGRQLEEEREKNEKLNAQLKNEREENENLRAGLKNERKENENLCAGLKKENENLGAGLKNEREENEKLNAELKNEREDNENLNAELENEREESGRLNAELKNEREENEKLDAELKIATLKNGKLIDLSRSQREQADQLGQVLEVVAAWVEKGVCPLRLPELIDGEDDLGEVATDDRAA
jgi:DNA repair exonuclease SbcCD ATPase subunit